MKYSILITAIAFLTLFAGCGKSDRPKGMPPIYKTVLTFTQEGKPLTGADITLTSKDQSCTWSVGGSTDANGKASVVTHGKFSGAPEGTFIITVTKTESEGVENTEVRTKPIKIYSFVEKKYTSEKTSPLEITIKKDNNDQTYELGKSERVLIETISVKGA